MCENGVFERKVGRGGKKPCRFGGGMLSIIAKNKTPPVESKITGEVEAHVIIIPPDIQTTA